MDKVIVGKKCVISEQLEPLIGSFKSANIEWKKKYKKYLGQSAVVLSLYGDDSVMLKFQSGKVYKFPRHCVSRSERIRDELRRENRRDSRRKKSFEIKLDDDVLFAEINSRASPEDVQIQERPVDRSSKEEGCTDMNQLNNSNDDTMKTKVFGQMWEFLEALNLQDYHRKLVEDGFESLEYLENAKFSDLIAAGMKLGHARRLLRAMKEYRASPIDNFQSRHKNVVKRASCCSSQTSMTGSCASSRSSNLSRTSMPDVHNDFEDLQSVSDLGVSYSRRLSNSTSSLSESQSSTISTEGGYLIIPFTKRPLGFGIMSPLCVGAMVSSILDEELKGKRLCLGLPLLKINHCCVSSYNVEEIAIMLSCMNVPLTVTFGLNPYFGQGQRLTVMKNNRWYECTVEDMSNSKVTVRYEDSSLGLNNIEKISDYNRIKQCSRPGANLLQQVFHYKLSKVPYLKQVSPQLTHCNSSDNSRGDEDQNGSGISLGGSANYQQFSRCNDAEQPALQKRRRQHLSNYMKKTNERIPKANSMDSLNISASNGHISKMI